MTMPYDLNDPKDRERAWQDFLWKDHGILRQKFHNLHEVGGGMWRSNQPSPQRLEALAEQGFKTILNIRGTQPGVCYYDLEKDACERLGLVMIDMPFGSREAPYVDRMQRAVKIFDEIAYPALIHCKSGADRAGIISVLFALTKLGLPYEEAIQHLSLKYLHVKAGKTGVLDHFFETYRQYNETTPIGFMDWVETVYDREVVQSSFMASWWGSFLTERVLRRE
ncbi:fused DSP-PTPase phosphatase/NAD kinase-like protein [Maricaulis parjimensis]|uniref:fused DSP-PTPase phosphatase/NAD kinase-like protein n=1 Tax=Maricaulis parjimensis TaxID=144023 RepID=UPI001EED5D29|nr:sulfur transferase domain-containing protein [Maricaulis parjimensis]